MDAELADPFDPPTTFEYPSVKKVRNCTFS